MHIFQINEYIILCTYYPLIYELVLYVDCFIVLIWALKILKMYRLVKFEERYLGSSSKCR
jgi:hypothetical protein